MKFNLVLGSIAQLFVSLAFAITPGVQQLVEWETGANAAAQRTSEVVSIPHYEIPLKLVGTDFALRLDPGIRDSLVFLKEGEMYVRWILNPDDTRWYKDVERFLEKNGVEAVQHYYFLGYKTASRSYIIENPENGAQFSAKSSTNITGGQWRDKKQPIGEAEDSRLMSDFLQAQNLKKPFQRFLIMDEPAIMTISDLDQAVVIRDLGELKIQNSEHIYIPGFSVLHEKVGREIAALHKRDPYSFWTEHYIRVAGLALGELAARTGLQFDSPHSQNFLVELDLNFKPTGRLVLRDMADLYVDATFIKNLLPEAEANSMIEKFTQKSNIHDYISAGFGPLHGNKYPSWVSDRQYSAWERVFADAFNESIEDISGRERARFKTRFYQSGEYFTSQYRLTQIEDFKKFFRQMQESGVANYIGDPFCRHLFR